MPENKNKGQENLGREKQETHRGCPCLRADVNGAVERNRSKNFALLIVPCCQCPSQTLLVDSPNLEPHLGELRLL